MAMMIDGGDGGYFMGSRSRMPTVRPTAPPPPPTKTNDERMDALASKLAELEERLVIFEVEKAVKEAEEIDEADARRAAESSVKAEVEAQVKRQDEIMSQMRRRVQNDMKASWK